jgi:signal transduction histidine kinase/ligand-binding sensor domain-containing protein
MSTPRNFRGFRWCRVAAFTTLIPGALALNPVQLAPSDYVRKNFTIEDGLPDSHVNAIVQSQNGYLWIGTEGGLARFDGQHFTLVQFRGENSREVAVHSLLSGSNGDLWVGTDSGLEHVPKTAADHFDRTLVRLYHPGAGLSDQVMCLHLNREGVLWVGTNRGLYLLDHGNFVTVIAKEMISRIEGASNDHLLIITSGGFAEWDGSRLLRHPEVALQLDVEKNEIFHVFEDRAGVTWFCTGAGVALRANGSMQRLSPYDSARARRALGNPAYRAYEDVQGDVWITTQKGLFQVAGAHLKPFDPALLARAIYCDQDGDLWIGTGDTGLARFRRRIIRMYTKADGLPNDKVETILSGHDGTLWVGNNCGGLSKFDGQRFITYSEKDGLSNSCVWSLAEDRHHDIWVGTWGGGFYRFRQGHFTQYSISQGLPSDVALSVMVAQDGSLWTATGGGLARMQGGHLRNYTMADGLSSDRIISVYEDQKGGIWAATSAGIDRLAGDRFVPVSPPPDVGDAPYNSLREDALGNLYALSLTSGISRIANNRIFNIRQTMEVSGMVQGPQHNLWFSGRQGISRISAESLERAQADNGSPLDYASFSRDDGLNSRECSAGQPNIAITPDGKLWTATRTGLAMLDLNQQPQLCHKSPVFVEEVEVGRSRQTPNSRLVLRPGAYHVVLHFTAVELASPENIRLQYRLDGVDPDWLDADATRTAIYTDIPVGTHSFHVRASNGDGIWDRAGISYEITQEPYFYARGWFRLVAGIAFFLTLTGGYSLRLHRIRAQMNARLDERVTERLRIARDLHDTLLQSFHGLLPRFQAVQNLLPGRIAEAQQVLEAAVDDAAQAITEARDAVQDLRSSTIVTNDLAKAIEVLGGELRAHQRDADGDSADFSVHVEGPPLDLNPILRDEIYRIAGEALRNAFHHARARRIEVEIRYAERQFSVRVRDDGIGIDASALSQEGRPGHFGLRGMRERSKSIGGQLEVWSEHGAGTEMELTMPATIVYGDRVARRLRLFKSKVGANS